MNLSEINRKTNLELEDYLFLKSGRDEYSDLSHEKLRNIIQERYPLQGWEMVKEIFYKLHKQRNLQLSCMRWVCRGLRMDLALQLVRYNSLRFKKDE